MFIKTTGAFLGKAKKYSKKVLNQFRDGIATEVAVKCPKCHKEFIYPKEFGIEEDAFSENTINAANVKHIRENKICIRCEDEQCWQILKKDMERAAKLVSIELHALADNDLKEKLGSNYKKILSFIKNQSENYQRINQMEHACSQINNMQTMDHKKRAVIKEAQHYIDTGYNM